jgi:hypothetical protein
VGQHNSASASRLLGLDGFEVLAAQVVGGEWQLEVQTTATVVGCQSCGVRAELHGRRTVRVRDLPISGRPVVLAWRKRLYATARDPSRPTLGGAVAAVAEQLGTPFMPWQSQVADVAMEVDPATELLAYDEIDATLPRQSGKTTLELAVLGASLPHLGPVPGLYSAQDRIHARAKWEDDFVATLDRSPFVGEYRVRYQRGDEAVRFHNGSRLGITAPGEKAGHSDVLDVCVADEA